ncbi:MAG: hypothetical protein ACRDV2_06625, partial [Actinomycetes bacterium]
AGVPSPRPSPVRPWLLRPHLLGGRRHSDGHYAARSVYGAIVVLAMLLALEEHPPGPLQAALVVAGTVLAVLVAEAYAELLGLEVGLGRPASRAERRAKLRDLGVMTIAAEGPVLVFVLAGLGLIDEDRAFRLAVWITIGMLFLEGFLARRMAGRSLPESLRSACAVGGIGIALAVFKHFAHG